MKFLARMNDNSSTIIDICNTQEGYFIQFPEKYFTTVYVICFTSTFISCLCVKINSPFKLIPLLLGLSVFMLFLIFIVSWRVEQRTNLTRNLNIMFQCYGINEMSERLNEQTFLQDMDHVQLKYNCCGIYSMLDWLETYDVIPTSCCYDPSSCYLEAVKSKKGCYTVIKKSVYHSWDGMIATLIIFIFMKLVVLALDLFNEITLMNEAN